MYSYTALLFFQPGGLLLSHSKENYSHFDHSAVFISPIL